MDFNEIVNKRYSCRSYDTEKQISRDVVEEIIEAGRLAPSACNSQPWKFIVVDEPEIIKEVAKTTQSALLGINKFTPDVKAFIVIVKETKAFSEKVAQIMKHRDYVPYDIGIVSATMCYKATELGVGTCILGWYDGAKIQEILGVPQSKSVELLIALGYPKSDEVPQKRRKQKEIVLSYNKYE